MQAQQCKLSSDWQTASTCNYTFAHISNEFVDDAATYSNEDPPDDLVVRLVPPSQPPFTDGKQCVYMHFAPQSALRLRGIRIVCTANKAELFAGHMAEYQNSIAGENICPDDADAMPCYLYDLPLNDVSKATLKV